MVKYCKWCENFLTFINKNGVYGGTIWYCYRCKTRFLFNKEDLTDEEWEHVEEILKSRVLKEEAIK